MHTAVSDGQEEHRVPHLHQTVKSLKGRVGGGYTFCAGVIRKSESGLTCGGQFAGAVGV